MVVVTAGSQPLHGICNKQFLTKLIKKKLLYPEYSVAKVSRSRLVTDTRRLPLRLWQRLPVWFRLINMALGAPQGPDEGLAAYRPELILTL